MKHKEKKKKAFLNNYSWKNTVKIHFNRKNIQMGWVGREFQVHPFPWAGTAPIIPG